MDEFKKIAKRRILQNKDESIFMVSVIALITALFFVTLNLSKNYLDYFTLNSSMLTGSTFGEVLKSGFHNIYVLNNCKELEILSEEQLPMISNLPYKLCTFSRVMLEKGIEIAIEAVKIANEKHGKELFHLDIYGQIDKDYEERFTDIMKAAPKEIRYKGVVAFDKSVDVLKEYCAVVFPTYYHGEGFAGTLIDAMASGVPVIASDWKYNSEVVKNEQTGILLRECTSETVATALGWLLDNMTEWDKMRRNCLTEATKYMPEQAIKVLLHELV